MIESIQSDNRWAVNGSIFVKSAVLEVIDDPCGGVVPPVDPPVNPPPVTGECQFDDSSILLAVNSSKQAVLNAINGVIDRLDNLTLKVQP